MTEIRCFGAAGVQLQQIILSSHLCIKSCCTSYMTFGYLSYLKTTFSNFSDFYFILFLLL